MLFLFKKKTVVLDCFTRYSYCAELFPVEKATKYFPEWFKKLSNTGIKHNGMTYANMKSCPGFLDYFTNSFTVPMWDFLHAAVDHQNTVFQCHSSTVEAHDRRQFAGFLDESYLHCKLLVPWAIRSKQKVKFIQTFPMWCYEPKNNPEKFLHCPGVMDFYNQSSSHINFFLKRPDKNESPYNFSLEPNKPLIFYTPMEDVNIKIAIHQVTSEEFDKHNNILSPTGAQGRYRFLKKRRDQLDKEKKCPFGFGK